MKLKITAAIGKRRATPDMCACGKPAIDSPPGNIQRFAPGSDIKRCQDCWMEVILKHDWRGDLDQPFDSFAN